MPQATASSDTTTPRQGPQREARVPAADLLTAIEAIDLTAIGEESEEEAQVLDSLAGGVFVGRQKEMGELKAALEDVYRAVVGW